MLGWILIETPKGRFAWPVGSTRIETHNDGYKLTCGDSTLTVDDIDFTLDIPAMMSFLHPEDDEPDEGGEE